MAEPNRALTKGAVTAQSDVIVQSKSAQRVDRDLVDRTVSQIREVLAKTVARGIDEVGRHLLQAFYDDDPELYYSSSPSKHASLRLLMDRCESMELPISRTFLANALRMAAVTKGLPRAATFNQLPPSHRVELLRLKAPGNLERVASKALAEKLSVQKLRTLVQKEVERAGTASGRGRKRTPVAVQAIDACLRALRDEETGRLLVKRSDLDEMTEEQAARAQAALTSLEKRVAELRRLMG